MTNINLTMNKWHLQDKMPYIYLGESGENNVVVLNVEVDDLITSTNDTKVTYFVDIYNQDNLQVANTQPFDIIDNKLVAKLTKGFLTVNGIKKLQIRCVVTDNDYNELQTYLSNQIHASVGQGNFGTTYNTDLVDVDTSCKLIIEIFEKFQELFDITNDLKDDIAQQESDLNNLDGIAQKFENIDDGDVDTLLDVRYIYFVTNSLHLPTNGKYLVMPLGNTSVCYGQCAINCETQAIYFRNNEIENDVITWHEWVSSNDAQEQEIQQIKDDVQALTDNVDTLSDNVNGLHTNIEDLDNSVDNLQDNFSQLQSNVNGLSNNVQTLNNSVNSLNNDIQTLDDKVDEIESEIPYVTPEMFGAVGDGMTDDTDAIQSVINVNKPIIFNSNGNYKITQRITLKNNTIYDFGGATVTCYNGAGFNIGNTENITIQNINLIGSEESGYSGRIICIPYNSSAENFKLLNSNIINYYKDSKTNQHAQWAFLGSGSNMIFDNCHIDTHLGGCWGGCVHFAYGQNIKITNCWIYGGDDAIAPLPHCYNSMFGDLSDINVGLSLYIDNSWIASWYAYCVALGTFLAPDESEHTEALPPSDNIAVYITNSKLHNHVFKDGTRNDIASHHVNCVNCEFTYDPTLSEDLGYPYQSYTNFILIGASSNNDIINDDARYKFDDCYFDLSNTQTSYRLINTIYPISHLSILNSNFVNNGKFSTYFIDGISKELLIDNVNIQLNQTDTFIREAIAERIIIRNNNISGNISRILILDNANNNTQYIEITNNIIELPSLSDACILYDSPLTTNANIIIKNNTTNKFIPSVGFTRDNNIYDIDTPITLDVNTKPYLIHKADYMLVKPQGESWLLNNCKFLAKPLAQSISSLNAFKYFACTKLNQAVIPFDFSMFGDNIIENTPCKTVIKSIDNFGTVSIFEATSSSEYITVTEDFYLYLASGQCGNSYDWSTMTVYFDDNTTLDVWSQPTLIQTGKVIKKVILNIKHNTLYQSENIVYQFATKRNAFYSADSIINNTVSNIDIYNNIINYDATFAWKANNVRLLNTSNKSFSNLFVDLADNNIEIIVSPIFQAHNFEFDYYVDWNNSSDMIEFTAQELQAMW